ncbi:MAG: thioredoxin domain-containing protein [Firmicutes bacterium]|nr:thioredoxin domain-containing protein [Bacillota bacterium]
MSKIIEITAENFDKEIANGTVLVKFKSVWCGPCKMLGPILEQVAADVDTKIFSIDIDTATDIAAKCDVMSVPTMIVFKDGKEAERVNGLRAKAFIVEMINRNK